MDSPLFHTAALTPKKPTVHPDVKWRLEAMAQVGALGGSRRVCRGGGYSHPLPCFVSRDVKFAVSPVSPHAAVPQSCLGSCLGSLSPTPIGVLDRVMRAGWLQDGDLLYDLGCGDGRIVFEAARLKCVRAGTIRGGTTGTLAPPATHTRTTTHSCFIFVQRRCGQQDFWAAWRLRAQAPISTVPAWVAACFACTPTGP